MYDAAPGVPLVSEIAYPLARADALVTLAETTLKHGPESLSTAERYQVVVHVTAETLTADETGRCELDNGQGLAPDTVRRLACDASLLRITADDAGKSRNIRQYQGHTVCH